MKIKPMSPVKAAQYKDEADQIREQMARAGVEKMLEELQSIGDVDLVDASEREIHIEVKITE